MISIARTRYAEIDTVPKVGFLESSLTLPSPLIIKQ